MREDCDPGPRGWYEVVSSHGERRWRSTPYKRWGKPRVDRYFWISSAYVPTTGRAAKKSRLSPIHPMSRLPTGPRFNWGCSSGKRRLPWDQSICPSTWFATTYKLQNVFRAPFTFQTRPGVPLSLTTLQSSERALKNAYIFIVVFYVQENVSLAQWRPLWSALVVLGSEQLMDSQSDFNGIWKHFLLVTSALLSHPSLTGLRIEDFNLFTTQCLCPPAIYNLCLIHSAAWRYLILPF